MVVENQRLVLGADRLPITRLAVLPGRDVTILETWDSLGLRGSGSHDVQVENAFCADAWTCSLADCKGPRHSIQAVPLIDYAGLFVAAVVIGIAFGALQDIASLAVSGKRGAFSSRALADDPVFHDRLGEAHMQLLAARALLYFQARQTESNMAGVALSSTDRLSLRSTCSVVTAQALRATEMAYQSAGSSVLPGDSSLQRRLRDIQTAMLHAWNGRDFAQNLGVELLDVSRKKLAGRLP
jgi:alkylation response protein AidB-like acyl-CoA dehydrogenase